LNNDIKIRHYISPNGDFEFQHSVADPPENVPRETHHDQYEIHMYLRGHITFFAEGYSYKGTRGDTIIINGHELHKVKIESQIPYERIVIHFKESYISDIENFGTSSLLSFINKKKMW
jgi:quercetin dioxygenase-like cupin family protein